MAGLPPAEPVIRLEAVHKWFGRNHVLRGIDLSVFQGQVVCVIGPSGSGKSTLLRCINLLEEPASGHVWFEGRDITAVRTDLNNVRTKTGIVFQQFNLFPHKSALDNVTLGLEKVLRMRKDDARELARRELAHVGLTEKEDAYPARISGGQQ